MGKGFSIEPKRDAQTGIIQRDADNNPIIDSDFTGLTQRFEQFIALSQSPKAKGWDGARVSSIIGHSNLDMKPRRVSRKAVQRRLSLEQGHSFLLSDVADVVDETIDLQDDPNFGQAWRLVEGISIRAVEGTVMPHEPVQAWEIIDAKQRKVFHLSDGDIIVGLVRPERRNIGLLMDTGADIVGTPDGVAVVRIRPGNKLGIDQAYLFSALRSEDSRIQLWTESGGTSYGKLNRDHILNIRIKLPTKKEVQATSKAVNDWIASTRTSMALWNTIGTADDRTPIVNSPMFGLEAED
jgi:type I restriction enzyme M protein